MEVLLKSILLLLYFQTAFCCEEATSWDQLRVTFLKFSRYPLTSGQAKAPGSGWKQDSHCSGKAEFFTGNRFTRINDDATRLIFDCDGSLAGIQATIKRSANYPTKYNQPPWLPTDDGRVALTAYFRNPKEICVCKPKCKQRMRKKPPIGDRLWIQMADFRFSEKVMVSPLNRNQLTDTPWIEGTCIRAMGLHYHYNISIGFDCDKALPFFLLFCPQSKSLIGFGWGGPFHVSSDEWEKPSPLVFGRSMKPESTPACLKNFTDVSVQHVYFVDPMKIDCSKVD